MPFSDMETFLKRFRQKPSKALALLLALALAGAAAAWLNAYFSEKGKRAAEPAPPAAQAEGAKPQRKASLMKPAPPREALPPPSPVTIEQMTVGTGETETSVFIVISNSAPAPTLLKWVRIEGSLPARGSGQACRGSVAVEETVAVQSSNQIRIGKKVSGNYPSGFTYPVSASWSGSALALQIDSALQIPGHSFYELRLIIPNILRVDVDDCGEARFDDPALPFNLDLRQMTHVRVQGGTPSGEVPPAERDLSS